MSRSQSAFLTRKDMPSRRDLQQALDRLELKVTLDDAYVPFTSSGYLPCTIDGEDSGFTIKFQDVGAHATEAQPWLTDKDVEILFRWSGDPREAACALAVGAALAQQFSAIVLAAGESVPFETAELVARARKAAASL